MDERDSGDDKHLLVITTCDDKRVLLAIANSLVAQKFAACCQIHGPNDSIYQWEGSLKNAQEFVCSIKTVAGSWSHVERLIKQHHSYDEPEIIALPIDAGSQSYLDWVRENSSGTG